MGNYTEKKHKGHRCWSSKKWMGLSKRRLRGDDQSNVRIAVRSRHPSQTIDGNKYFKPCCACVNFFYTSVNAKLNAVILYFFSFPNLISVLLLLSHAWLSPLALSLCLWVCVCLRLCHSLRSQT